MTQRTKSYIQSTWVDGAVVGPDDAASTDDLWDSLIFRNGDNSFTGEQEFEEPIVLDEQSATPAAPSAGTQKIFVQTDGLHMMDPSGNDRRIIDEDREQTLANKMLTNPGLTKQTLTDAANIAWDMSNGNMADVTLGGNRTLDNPTNLVNGSAVLIVKQDATGGRTLAFGTAYKFPGGVAPTLSTAANAVDIITFIVDADAGVLYGVAQTDFS